MEVKRFLNNEEILGAFPEILWENESVNLLFQSILAGSKEVGEVS